MIEWLLAANTDVIAACSTGERESVLRWPTALRPIYVPNYAERAKEFGPLATDANLVVAVGRIGPQKDPDFLVDVASELRGLGASPRIVWVGDGDEAMRARLVDANITCSGWLPRNEVMRRVAQAAVYIHTARWEGFPVALLEAHAANVPIVARTIRAFEGCAPRWTAETPRDMARMIDELLAPERTASRDENRQSWTEALVGNTALIQRKALIEAYGVGSVYSASASEVTTR